MSRYDYEQSKQIAKDSPPFYAIIMAAAREADTFNLERLEAVFPETVAELRLRYNAPGGILHEGEGLHE